MSVSKFESLPNEILIDLLENYFHPIDVFVVFANDLNNRFTSLFHQCQLFNLDLTNLSKKDFDRCINTFSNCYDQIGSLSLSSCLPSEMNIFLLLYPRFDKLVNLGSLYLYFNEPMFEMNLLLFSFYFLSETKLHTLSLKILNGENSLCLMENCQEYFRLKTMRRLILDVGSYSHNWNLNNLNECSIEELTILGGGFTWFNLKKIFSIGIHLKYLNIRLTTDFYHNDISTNEIDFNPQSLKQVDTLIIHCYESQGPIGIELIFPYLKEMFNLRRLSICSLMREHLDGNSWEKLIQRFLPFLTYFTLIIYNYFLPAYFEEEEMIKSFQTSFWINQKNFNIFRSVCQWNNYKEFNLFYYPIQYSSYNNINLEDALYIWTLPLRSLDNNSSSLTMITRLLIRQDFPIPSNEYKLNNIKDLQIDYINYSLFQWINTSINLSKINQLNILHVQKDFHLIISLISKMSNLNILMIDLNQLIDQSIQLIEINQSIKRLDISIERHSFQEKDILFIGNLFSSIEHLQINTKDLHNVPLLKNYLPNLITLTFIIIDLDFQSIRDDEKWEARFRSQVNFQYQRRDKSITIWIDQYTFDDPFWQSTFKGRYKFKFLNKIKTLAKKFNRS